MAEGFHIGDAYVQVIASFDRFQRDVAEAFNRVSDLTVRVKPDVDQRQFTDAVNRATREASGATPSVRIGADTAPLRRDVDLALTRIRSTPAAVRLVGDANMLRATIEEIKRNRITALVALDGETRRLDAKKAAIKAERDTVLFQIDGDFARYEATKAAIKADVIRKTVQIDANIARYLAEIEAIKTLRIDKLARIDADATNYEASRARILARRDRMIIEVDAKIAAAEAEVRELTDSKRWALFVVPDVKLDKANATLEALQARKVEILAAADLDIGKVDAKLAALAAERVRVTVKAEMDTANANTKLDALQRERAKIVIKGEGDLSDVDKKIELLQRKKEKITITAEGNFAAIDKQIEALTAQRRRIVIRADADTAAAEAKLANTPVGEALARVRSATATVRLLADERALREQIDKIKAERIDATVALNVDIRALKAKKDEIKAERIRATAEIDGDIRGYEQKRAAIRAERNRTVVQIGADITEVQAKIARLKNTGSLLMLNVDLNVAAYEAEIEALREKREEVKLQAVLDTAKVDEDIAKLREKREEIKLKAKGDFAEVDTKIAALESGKREIKLKAGTDTAEVRAKLDALVGERRKIALKVEAETGEAAAKISALGNTIEDSSSRSGRSLLSTQGRFQLLLAAIVIGSPIIGAALVAGLGAGFIAVAFLAERHNQQVKESFKSTWHDIEGIVKSESDQLAPILIASANQIDATVRKIGPALSQAMSAAGPDIVALTRGIDNLVANAMPGMAAAMQRSLPVFQGLATMLGTFGTALGNMFDSLTQHSGQLGAALVTFGQLFSTVLATVTTLINQLTQIWANDGGAIVGAIQSIFGALTGLTSGALPMFGATLAAASQIIRGFLAVLTPIAPALGFVAGVLLSGKFLWGLWAQAALLAGKAAAFFKAVDLVPALNAIAPAVNVATAAITKYGTAVLGVIPGINAVIPAFGLKTAAQREDAAADAELAEADRALGIAEAELAAALAQGAAARAEIALANLRAAASTDAAAVSEEALAAAEAQVTQTAAASAAAQLTLVNAKKSLKIQTAEATLAAATEDAFQKRAALSTLNATRMAGAAAVSEVELAAARTAATAATAAEAAATEALAAAQTVSSAAMGPVGIALAGIALLAVGLSFAFGSTDGSTIKLTGDMDDLTAALEKSHGAFTQTAIDSLKGSSDFKAVAKSVDQFGISSDDLVDALTKGGPALDALKAKLQGVVDAHTKVTTEMGPHGVYTETTREIDAVGQAAQAAMSGFDGLAAEANKSSATAAAHTAAQDGVAHSLANSTAYQERAAAVAKILGLSQAEVTAGFERIIAAEGPASAAIDTDTQALIANKLALDKAADFTTRLAQADAALAQANKAAASADRANQQAIVAVTDAKHNAEAASRAVTAAHQAEESAARALAQANQAVGDANAGVVIAENSLTKAQDAERESLVALNKAREQAVQDLKDLHLQLEDQTLSEEQARAQLFDATQTAAGLGITQDNAKTIAAQDITPDNEAQVKAAFDLVSAMNGVNDSLNTGTKLRKQVADSDAAGVDGATGVISAQKALLSAQDQVTSATQGLAKAHEAVANAMYAVQQADIGLARAHQGVSDAEWAQQKASVAVKDAQDQQALALDALHDANDAVRTATEKASRSLDGSTKAGQDNLGSVRDLIGYIKKEVNPTFGDYETAISAVATAYHISNAEAIGLMQTMGLFPLVPTPASIEATFWAGGDIPAPRPAVGIHAPRASGGWIAGPGGPTADTVPAMLSNGEFVVNAAAASKYGPMLERMNTLTLGGPVRSYSSGGPVLPPGYSTMARTPTVRAAQWEPGRSTPVAPAISITVHARTDASPEHIAHTIDRHLALATRL